MMFKGKLSEEELKKLLEITNKEIIPSLQSHFEEGVEFQVEIIGDTVVIKYKLLYEERTPDPYIDYLKEAIENTTYEIIYAFVPDELLRTDMYDICLGNEGIIITDF